MAHTKASGVTKGNRDSKPKNLGVKLYAGEHVEPGNIIVRQRGSKFNPGTGTQMGNDYTIFAVQNGVLKFAKKLGKTYIEVSAPKN